MTPYWSDGHATIWHGNALALPLEDESVDLVVTSPPYFGLRSYQDKCAMCRDVEACGADPREAFPDWDEHTRKMHHYAGQIGSEPTPAEFVDALIAATREMVRVLKPSGSIWINLGDKYATYAGNRSSGRSSLQGSTDRCRPVVPRKNGLDGGGTVPAKSLMGIPWRYARDSHGVDLSSDYCRLAKWRITDPGEIARAMQVQKPEPVIDGQTTIFDEVPA